MTKPTSIPDEEVFGKLWLHEASRVFADRLINVEDRTFFREKISEMLKNRLKMKADL